MKKIIEDIRLKKKLVEKLDFTQFKPSLGRIFNELIRYPEISEILITLDDIIDEKDLMKKKSYDEPAVSNFIEQAAIGSKIISDCTSKYFDFFSIMGNYGIRNWGGPDTADRLLKKAKQKYVIPFFDYLTEVLENQQYEISVDNEIQKRLRFITNLDMNPNFIETNKQIKKVQNLINATEEISWSSVANSCRNILVLFSNELKRHFSSIDCNDLQNGNVKGILNKIINENKSRYTETLSNLINSIWDHTSSATHKHDISKDEAIRVFVWTLLIIAEIEMIVLKSE